MSSTYFQTDEEFLQPKFDPVPYIGGDFTTGVVRVENLKLHYGAGIAALVSLELALSLFILSTARAT